MADAAAPPAAAAGTHRRRAPGLIDLYLIRGASAPFLLVTLFAGAAMMLERALRLVHELFASGADLGYFLPLLAQLAPYYVNLALPAGLFVAFVLLVARLDERLELEAMLASGLSLARIAAPLTAVAAVVALLSLVVGGWLEPQGRHAFRSTKAVAVNAGRIAMLEPRAFYRPAEALALTFDRRAADGAVTSLFLWQRVPSGRELVLTARRGSIGLDADGGDMVFELNDGRYVADPVRQGQRRPLVLRFSTIRMQESLLLRETLWERGWDQKEMTIPELAVAVRDGSPRVGRDTLRAELYSRIARALSILLLPWLVLPLAFAVKKGRRGLGVLLGGALLIAFQHALNFAKDLGVVGAADPRVTIPVALAVFALGTALLFRSGRHLPSHSPVATAMMPISAVGASVQARRRRRSGVRRRTIGGYVAATLTRHILFAGLAAVAILQMVDMFDRGDQFFQRGMGLADMAYYALLRLPPTLQLAIPVAALGGAMSSFMTLSRSREMVAIRAAGISQFRILRMALPIFLALAIAMYLLAEIAVPASQTRFSAWWSTSPVAGRTQPPEARWFRIGSDIVRALAAAPDGSRLDDVTVFRRAGDGLIAERIKAAHARREPAGWVLEDVRTTRFGGAPAAPEASARVAWRTRLQSDDVQRFFAGGSQLSSAAARRALDVTAPVDRGEALFQTRVLRTFAEPVAPLVMLLLALPLAFVAWRTQRIWPALLYAAGGGLLYLVGDGVLTVMAQVGRIPPPVGAWAGPVLGLLVGWCVLLYSER